jgi:hypothetical protein
MTTLQDTFDLPTFPLMLSYSKSALVGETLAYSEPQGVHRQWY